MAIESYHFDFMLEAIREAEASIAQGGLPIGAVLTRDNKIVARGHNNRVQEKNVILHGEMSCLRDAGLMSFHDTVMYTTLSPCSMCAGAIGLFELSLLVIGESVTFPGSKDILTQFGIPFIDLADERSFNMMKSWRSSAPSRSLTCGACCSSISPATPRAPMRARANIPKRTR